MSQKIEVTITRDELTALLKGESVGVTYSPNLNWSFEVRYHEGVLWVKTFGPGVTFKNLIGDEATQHEFLKGIFNREEIRIVYP